MGTLIAIAICSGVLVLCGYVLGYNAGQKSRQYEIDKAEAELRQAKYQINQFPRK